MDDDRKKQILKILRAQYYVTVDDLCSQLFVSSATVRRDLKVLADNNQIIRVHGGAYILDGSTIEEPYSIREKKYIKEKQIIASQAIKHIRDGMVVFLDSSSTVFHLASIIEGFNNLCIITNSLKTAYFLANRKGIYVRCTSGMPRVGTLSLVGQTTVDYIRRYNANVAFVSACGFDTEYGTSEASDEESSVKRAYIENAREKYLLCTKSKMYKRFLCKTATLDEFTKIITENETLNSRLNRKFSEQNVNSLRVSL
jgi:DeoR/GlpR family transcriptional regulator of sugar metabolism